MALGVIRVGCSGWSYRDWRGVVYPAELPQRRWFEYYQELFDTVELNNTFYRLPRPEAVEKWAAAAVPGFLYAMKLGAYGSHRKKLTDPEQWLPNHFDRAARFGAHLGPTLVQLPPRWRRNTARLDEFLDAVGPALTTQRWAVEVRDATWLADDVFEVLRHHGVALCIHDLLDDHPFELTADWTYIRFHGPDAIAHPYHGRYDTPRMEAWAGRLAELAERGIDSYTYFNNDWHGAAVADAAVLRAALGQPMRVPVGLRG